MNESYQIIIPEHPGLHLKRVLDKRGLTAHAFALKLRVSPDHIIEIIKGHRAITAKTALRMSRCLNIGARTWLEMQMDYNLAVAKQRFGTIIDREVERG